MSGCSLHGCPDSHWQTDNSLTNTSRWTQRSQPSTPELRLDSATHPNASWQTPPPGSERTHLSPRKHRAVTKDTGLSSCARTLWVAVCSSLEALRQPMRERETKKDIGKARERIVFGSWVQMESFHVSFFIFYLLFFPPLILPAGSILTPAELKWHCGRSYYHWSSP